MGQKHSMLLRGVSAAMIALLSLITTVRPARGLAQQPPSLPPPIPPQYDKLKDLHLTISSGD